MFKYPPCFRLILTHLPSDNESYLASFCLSFLKLLCNSGVSSFKEINDELDNITRFTVPARVSRTSYISTKEIGGKKYNIADQECYSKYVSALHSICKEPLSFAALLECLGFSQDICQLCPYSTDYTLSEQSTELFVAKYMLLDIDQFDEVMDLCSYHPESIFRSAYDLFNILKTGYESVIFQGIALLINSISNDPMSFFDLDRIPPSFEQDLINAGIPESLLDSGKNREKNVHSIFHYLLNMANSASLPLDFKVSGAVLSLKKRNRYVPALDADTLLFPPDRLTEIPSPPKNNELNEIKISPAKKETFRKGKRLLEVVDVFSFEKEAFSEFDTFVSSSELSPQSAQNIDTIYIDNAEVVDASGNLVDPNLLSDENSAMDFDNEPEDCSENGFSWNSKKEKPDHPAKSRGKIANLESDTNHCSNQANNLIPEFLTINDQFVPESISSDAIHMLCFSACGEPYPEADRAISIFCREKYVYAEPVILNDKIALYLFSGNNEFVCEIPDAVRILHHHEIKKISLKPYLLYSSFANTVCKSNSYFSGSKFKELYPAAELARDILNLPYYSSIPLHLTDRAKAGIDLIRKCESVRPIDTNDRIFHLVSVFGFNLNRKRYISALSENDSEFLFTLQSDGKYIPCTLNTSDIFIQEEIKHESFLFRVIFFCPNNPALSLYQEIMTDLFVFLDCRGHIRSLPFSIISFSKDSGEIVLLSLSYCYQFLRTLLIQFLDHISHQKGFRDVWIDVEVIKQPAQMDI